MLSEDNRSVGVGTEKAREQSGIMTTVNSLQQNGVLQPKTL